MSLTTETVQRLLTWADATAYLETLSDADLADLLEQTVWTDLPLMTPASDVVREAIERLRQGRTGGGRRSAPGNLDYGT